jgi:hypothetical protein
VCVWWCARQGSGVLLRFINRPNKILTPAGWKVHAADARIKTNGRQTGCCAAGQLGCSGAVFIWTSASPPEWHAGDHAGKDAARVYALLALFHQMVSGIFVGVRSRGAALRFASADCCHFSARGPPLVNKSKSLFLCVRIPRRCPYETLNSFASLCGTCWEINANPAASINKLLLH